MKKINKKYLVITPFFPSNESFRGSYIFDQLNEIRKQSNFDIDIIKVVPVYSNENEYIYGNFIVRIFKVIDFPFFIFPSIFNFINKVRFKFFLFKKKLTDIGFIHSHVSYPSAYLVEDLKCIKIIQHHGLDVFQINNGRIKLIRNIQKSFLIKKTTKMLNAADLNIGVSRLVLKNMYNYSDYIPKREFVLYNGVDSSKFFKKSSHKNVIFTIGCIGNFSKTKGQIYLIKSVQKIIECGKKINLRLIGSGSTLQLCKTYVFEHKLSEYIFFENEISHNKLNNFYNAIDLFVLPSYYEALGCVYLESWATETPFIAIIDQGISELIPDRDKNRILALKQSVVSLQEKILLVFDERHDYPFNDKYNIKNTISEYLKHPLFYAE